MANGGGPAVGFILPVDMVQKLVEDGRILAMLQNQCRLRARQFSI